MNITRQAPNRRRTNAEKGSSVSKIFWVVAVLLLGWAGVMYFYWRKTLTVSAPASIQAFVQDELKTAGIELKAATAALQTALDTGMLPPKVEVAKPSPAAAAAAPPRLQEAVKRDEPPKEPKAMEIAAKASGEGPFHTVFSTDCTPFQDWQTLLVFHSAKVAGQQGPITRIASGCDDAKKEVLMALYKKLHPEYHVHFTPDFKLDKKTGKKYDFYNKPYGLLHWLENANPPVESGTVIGLIDPDMIFLRPLTARVKGDPNVLFTAPVTANDLFEYAGRGRPVAQQYSLGAPWTYDNHAKFNRTAVCGVGSPCLKVPNERTGAMHYSVGPPYILERDDFHRLAKTWVEFVPKVYEGYPHLLAEMYAYSMGAAHEALPHLRLDHYMVSNIHAGDEGWKWIDALPNSCVAPKNGIFFPERQLPTFVHYCQFYRAKEIGFQKRRVYNNMFSCEREMLLDLPEELSDADYMIRNGNYEKVGPHDAKRSSFVLCTIHQALNAALLHYKSIMCQGNPKTNYTRSFNVVLNY